MGKACFRNLQPEGCAGGGLQSEVQFSGGERLEFTPAGRLFTANSSRLRASATADGAVPMLEVCCITSVAMGSAGRLPLRRVPPPTTWASITTVSAQITAAAMRTVFSCVASRNRERTERENDESMNLK